MYINLASDDVWIQEMMCYRVTSLLVYFNVFARIRTPELEDKATVKRLAKPLYNIELGLVQRKVWPLHSASGM